MALTWSDYGQGGERRRGGGGRVIAALVLVVVVITAVIMLLARPSGNGTPPGSETEPTAGTGTGGEEPATGQETTQPGTGTVRTPPEKIPGEEEFEAGEYAAAASKLEQFLAGTPGDREPRALLLLGQAQRGVGSPARAAETFKKLLAKAERSPAAAGALYELACMEQDPKAAEGLLTRAVAPQYARTQGAALAGQRLGEELWKRDVAGPRKDYGAWELVRRALTRSLHGLEGKTRTETIERLRTLNKYLIYTKAKCTGSEHYTVQPNDSVYVIARRRGVTLGSIKRMNGLDEKATIRPGDELKILKAACFIEVVKSKFRLTAYLDDYFFNEYAISVGKEESPTPAGTYEIETKSSKPYWYYKGQKIPYGDPRNILGTRWLGFKDKPGASRLGIHGTTDPKSIGQMVSQGCIRMRNPDVEELYDFALTGTRVEVRD